MTRVLVVFGSKSMRLVLRRFLEEVEITAEAESGRAAFELLDPRAPPDLILVDWDMSVMDGLEFVMAVRAVPAFDGVPLMVTTEVAAGSLRLALKAGADEYLMKPFTRDAFMRKLEMLGFSVASRNQSGGPS